MTRIAGSREFARTRENVVIFSSNEHAFDQRLYHKVARSLKNAFDQVTVIGQANGDEVALDVRIVTLRKPRSRVDQLLVLPYRAFRLARAERGDLYYFSDAALLPWAWLLQRSTGKPVIYDLREFQIERIREKAWIPWVLKKAVAWAYGKLERLVAGRLAGAVAVNSHLAAYLKGCGCRRVAIVPNYPPRSLFGILPRDPLLQETYGQLPVLVYAGVLARSRGITVAVEAAAQLRDKFPSLRLLLIGQFSSSSYRDELHNLIRDLGMQDQVDVVGRVPHERIPAYLATADVGLCLLQPSVVRYRWTEPIKYFECAAAGIPEVLSDLPDLRRLIERNSNGLLVDATDPEAVAGAVERLLRLPEEARHMGARGRQAFVETYNWEVASEALIALCREVLGDHATRG